jgi:hypothetical protein
MKAKMMELLKVERKGSMTAVQKEVNLGALMVEKMV